MLTGSRVAILSTIAHSPIDNDSAISAPRALELARHWGAEAGILSGAGHINVKSGHQRWEQGFAYLYRLQNRMEQHSLRRA